MPRKKKEETVTAFKTTHHMSGGDEGVAIVPEVVSTGSLAAGDQQKVLGLLEKASGLVASFTGKAESGIAIAEQEMGSLMAGEKTVDQLVSQYGQLSVAEAAETKHQLSLVMNSLEAQIQKTLVDRKAIELNKEKAFTVMAGLKAAFQLQGEAERVADARDSAEYEGKKREQNNVFRDGDIDFRVRRNALTTADNESKLAHKTQINTLNEQIRAAIRRGVTAKLQLKEFKTTQAETATNRIMGRVEAKTSKGAAK